MIIIFYKNGFHCGSLIELKCIFKETRDQVLHLVKKILTQILCHDTLNEMHMFKLSSTL